MEDYTTLAEAVMNDGLSRIPDKSETAAPEQGSLKGLSAQRLVSLCEVIKKWWEDHKYDTCGDYGDYNVYDDEPKFVTAAKKVIGDWES